MPTIQPAPGTLGYETQTREWNQDVRPQQYAAIIICITAATLAVAARLYSQRKYRQTFEWADASIIAALVIVYAQAIASFLSMVEGSGLHQLRVLMEDQNQPFGLQRLYTNYWIVSVLWAPGVMFIKLSILLTYARIFLVQQRWFKIALWTNAAYAVGLGVASTFVFIFQCAPVNYYWTRFVAYYGYPVPEGTCLPQLAHLVTPQILSTISDLVILFLPIPVIIKLQIQTARRLAILFAFSLGAFTAGCGIARISVIFHVSNEADVTWNNIDTVTFTVVECGVGIVCACLPATAPAFSAFMRHMGLMRSDETAPNNYNQRNTFHKPTFLSKGTRIPEEPTTDVEFQGLVPGSKTSVWSDART